MANVLADFLEQGYGHNVWAAGNYYFWVSKASHQDKSPTLHSDSDFQPHRSQW